MSQLDQSLGGAAGEGTFLGQLTPEARAALLEGAARLEIRGGDTIFSATETAERVGIILEGLARIYLHAPDGRRLSVRYARPGVMLGTSRDTRSSLSVQAVTDCTVIEFDRARLRAAIDADAQVALAAFAEISERLNDTYVTLAANTFGTMRERVARQLLDCASESPRGARMIAPITQQSLADAVGTVREVVARVLREFREQRLIATNAGQIELLDPDGVAAIVGRWR